MRLVNYDSGSGFRPGILQAGFVVDSRALVTLLCWPDTEVSALLSNRDLVAQPAERLLELGKAAERHGETLANRNEAFDVNRVVLGPPIPAPEKIICIGLNYHDHAEEVGLEKPAEPIFFAKFANSLVGPYDDIVPPLDTSRVDYEAELAVVIGKPGRYIEEQNALQHVAGAMVFNDVSARDLQFANTLWTGGKAIDTFAPCGPALVTMDEISSLQDLRLSTRVNGTTLQDGSTANMIFSVPRIISFLSRIMTLVPGDIIATGTPAGVAASHEPEQFLKARDIVEAEIEGLGCLRNRVRENA